MLRRVALVVHPSRPIDDALDTLHAWAREREAEVVQLELPPSQRQVADLGDAGPCDLVVALGGDGTVLTALRAAAPSDAPVLGVACGSLGALTATSADELRGALDRFAAGDWAPRELPALAIAGDAGDSAWALNDFVLTRGATGQFVGDVFVDDELYVRLAGDGVIVATVLGSSAYSMAAGGPIVAAGTEAFLVTPLAMHGGNAPPLVAPADATVTVRVHPSFARFAVEIDGHPHTMAGERFEVQQHPGKVRLVSFRESSGRGLEGLRRRRLIVDSPRVAAREDREKLQAQLQR